MSFYIDQCLISFFISIV